MTDKPVRASVILIVLLVLPTLLVSGWVRAAGKRLEANAATEAPSQVAVASAANREYCTGDLKKVLRRVLKSCGLLGADSRGCQPADAKSVATMAGGDFNALFSPLAQRAGIVQFDMDSAELDAQDTTLLDKVFADQGGASYFFVVSRASPEGSTKHNAELSKSRAENVLAHLRTKFNDPDLDREVGLLWLGEEFAQLDPEFCKWQRSGSSDACGSEQLNRSAFVAWIDCSL